MPRHGRKIESTEENVDAILRSLKRQTADNERERTLIQRQITAARQEKAQIEERLSLARASLTPAQQCFESKTQQKAEVQEQLTEERSKSAVITTHLAMAHERQNVLIQEAKTAGQEIETLKKQIEEQRASFNEAKRRQDETALASEARLPALIAARTQEEQHELEASQRGPVIFADQDPHDCGRLEMGNPLGTGSFAIVYRALLKDSSSAKPLPVAVKMISVGKLCHEKCLTEQEANVLFLKEALSMSIPMHANLMRPFGCAYSLFNPGNHAIVMPLMPEGSLATFLEQPPSDFTIQIELMLDIAQGIAVMHARELLHRDIKPENILLEAREDGRLRSRVSDFGLVCPDGIQGHDAGSPVYMAPEACQISDVGMTYTKEIDVFAFGVTVLQWVLRLEDGRLLEEKKQAIIQGRQGIIPESVPLPLKELIYRCCALDPRDRPPMDWTIIQLQAALTTFRHTPPLRAPSTGQAQRRS